MTTAKKEVVRKRILIVDDSHDTLDMMEIFLFKEFEIHTAQNGFEGLKQAQALLPNCIITDIMMPVMDGIKFFNNLRAREDTANIPVIAVTAFLKPITTKSLLAMGFSEVITKPFKLAQIQKMVRAVVERGI